MKTLTAFPISPFSIKPDTPLVLQLRERESSVRDSEIDNKWCLFILASANIAFSIKIHQKTMSLNNVSIDMTKVEHTYPPPRPRTT